MRHPGRARQALVNPGDDVVLLEPAFDLYYGQIRIAGGRAVPVPMAVEEEAHRWSLDVGKLEAAITPRTKLLVLNSPHNPTGKTFNDGEMEAIAAIVRKVSASTARRRPLAVAPLGRHRAPRPRYAAPRAQPL